MPRITPYEQQTSTPRPQGAVTLDFGSGVAAGALGAALENVADDRARLQAFERKKAEERAAVWANEQVMSLRSRWAEEFPRRQAEASETAEGFARQTLTDFDAQADEVIKQAPTQASRAWLKDRLGHVRLSMQQQALAFEAQRGVEFKVNGLTRSIDQARIAAEFSPEEFQVLAAEQTAAIEASGLSAETRAKLIQETQIELADAAVQGMIRRDPYEALRELNNEQTKTLSVRALPFDRRQVLRNAAEAEIRRLEAERKANLAEVRQALNDQLRDIQVAASNGMTITNIPSREALVAAFGEQEGGQRYQQAMSFAKLAPKVSALYTASAGEIAQTVQAFRPTQVEGAADQFAMLGIVQQKAQAILREREADPGGYLTAHSPTVREAWNTFQQASEDESSEAAANYLRAVRAEKERLGIQSHAVLPEAYADAVIDRLTRPQAAEQLSMAMTRERARWGESWPDVYRQLSPKLPSAANIIGSGIPKRAADTLALMSAKSDDELKVFIKDGNTLENVRTDVHDRLEDFTASFGGEGSKVVADMHDAVVRTAIGYMASGASYRDAITQAANDIANSRYRFQDFRGQAYRVPVDVDPDLVDDGATFFLQHYQQPPGTVQVPAGVREDVILAQATDHIRRTGYWRTAPDESGLRLYVGNAPVPGTDGQPVQLTWQQLEELAQQDAAEQFWRIQDEAARRAERSQVAGLR